MSIDVNVQNDLVIVTESSEDITVNVSNAQGPAGANGVGVPVGGSTNQVLKKLSGTNYDTYWAADGQGVPYSGATGDVNLGEFALSAGQLTLDTSPTGTASVGTTRWNDTTGVSETTLKGGSVILKNGVDLVARVVNKVSPNATLTKAAYQAVRVSGAQGQRLAVAYAQANNDANSADTIGLVCETIATNQEGFIMAVGQLEGINTTGSLQGETWVDGDVLYLSPFTPGAITKVKPTGAGHIVVIGYVEYAHVNNGKIYVKVMNGWELDELHDVSIVSPANNEALIYESATSLWKNKTIASALGYTPISGTGVSGQVAYWNGTSSQTGSSTLTYSPTTSLLVNNSVTAATAIARGTNLTPTLTASANSDVLVGLDVNPAFTNGAFTGVSNIGLRVLGNIAETYPAILIRNTSALSGATTVFRAQDNSTGVCEFGTGSTGGVFSNIAYFYTNKSILDFYANAGNRMRIYGSTGNVVLQNGGTFTDNGSRLQVTGTVRITGDFYTTGTNAGIRFYDGASGMYYAGGGIFWENYADWYRFGYQYTNQTSGTRNIIQTIMTFAPTSGTASYSIYYIAPTVNQTGGSNGIIRGLHVAPTLTAAADWRSIEWSNNSGWGLYGAGTANNYLAGRLGIGNTSPARPIDVLVSNDSAQSIGIKNSSNGLSARAGFIAFNDTTEYGGFFVTSSQFSNITYRNNVNILASKGLVLSSDDSLASSGTSRILFITGGYNNNPTLSITAGNPGRVLIGTTTESTFLLDVNGTARVQSKLSLSAGTTSNAQINLASSTAPTSPNNGDIWFDGTDLKMRIGGVTKTFTLL